MEISVGIKVAARGLEWDVMEVEPLGSRQRLRLACAAGDLQGLEWDVLHPPETVTVLRTDPRPEDAGPLDAWRRYHIACLLEQIPGAPAPPGRVAIEAYQRVPLLRALDMVRPRLLLADGVGLGKTIQAGLIAAELIVRRRGHRILVVCPPGPLLRQWEQEMRIRFGLRFTPITDSASLRDARRGLELGGNPFDAVALCLTSMDFAKQDRVLAELERVAWDLVIIDEAHHCAGGSGAASGEASGEASQRRRLAEVLARRGDGLLLLTATPHDGHDPHFASLIALLDPSLVDGAGRLVGNLYRRHVVRRLKSHIRDPRTGTPMFRERVIIPVRVDMTDAAPARDFHQALSALVAPRLRQSGGRGGAPDALAFVSLLKRSMSSIAACVATLRVVAARYADPVGPRRGRQRALRAWRRRLARFGVLEPSAEEEFARLEAEEMAASLTGGETRAALAALIRLGEAAAPADPKLAALVLEIRLIRLAHPAANILVYTEYADSQRAAVAALAAIGGTVLTISGADSEADRTQAAERCAAEECVILVSTDSLAEGLNLQQRCHHLIHLDLPYNPNRLEQRNGRIDRYGQRNDPEIRYLYLTGTFEERLLLHLIAKYEKARACLFFMPNTLAVTADPAALREPLLAGFAERPDNLFSGASRLVHSLDLAAEDEASDSYRDLLREIDRAFQSFDRMAVRHGWMAGGGAADPPAEPLDAGIDVPGFIASVLTPDGAAFRVPAEWWRDLDGLPGFDRTNGMVRLTADPRLVRDADGRGLMYPGRSHPLTRRAIALARSGRTGRVSAARADTVSLLMTYAAEVGSQFRTVFALRLFPDGTCQEQADFLSLAAPGKMSLEPWADHFANWAPRRITAAARRAAAVADRLATAFDRAHQDRVERAAATARAWLERRAIELCGPVVRVTGDLFEAGPVLGDWRAWPVAEQRLAGFIGDGTVPAAQRRDATESLSRYRAIIADQTPLPQPTVRTLGMLMLCP
ncbi:helicase-related protein [Rhodopila sp.]|uniref:helicase-related protein n=1 Tax=Rhodopila sp. TaxID=2480087 RepID=UPI003D0B69F5